MFCFAGIIFGLWVWLSGKYILNCLYVGGPQFKFKTRGIKEASDLLMRNYQDAFVYTGLFYDAAVNVYLLSNLNVAKDEITDSQKSLINQMLFLSLAQFTVFILLKFVSLHVEEIDPNISDD